MKEDKLKIHVQKIILTVSFLILVGKFTAYFLTRSVGVLTDAMESIVNVVAGFISLLSLRWAARPSDREHPFGHGKIELISASVEGILIGAAGVMIIYEGILRLLEPVPVQKLDVGILIVAVGGMLNYLLGCYSIRVGKKHDSIALVAGGKHLKSDTYSTIGLVAGLLVLYFTGIAWIDSALALLFGAIILFTGISILRKTIANLLDSADQELLSDLARTIDGSRQPEWVDIHNARVTKYGNVLHLDCDLSLPWYYTLEQGHRCGARFERILQERYSDRLMLTLHLDPCNVFEQPRCPTCSLPDCPYRKAPFLKREPVSLSGLISSPKEEDV